MRFTFSWLFPASRLLTTPIRNGSLPGRLSSERRGSDWPGPWPCLFRSTAFDRVQERDECHTPGTALSSLVFGLPVGVRLNLTHTFAGGWGGMGCPALSKAYLRSEHPPTPPVAACFFGRTIGRAEGRRPESQNEVTQLRGLFAPIWRPGALRLPACQPARREGLGTGSVTRAWTLRTRCSPGLSHGDVDSRFNDMVGGRGTGSARCDPARLPGRSGARRRPSSRWLRRSRSAAGSLRPAKVAITRVFRPRSSDGRGAVPEWRWSRGSDWLRRFVSHISRIGIPRPSRAGAGPFCIRNVCWAGLPGKSADAITTVGQSSRPPFATFGPRGWTASW